MNNCGVSVDAEYRAGVAAEIARLKPHIESGELAAAVLQSRSPSCGSGELAAAVLQSRSPSCGVHEVYDGTFTGRLIAGRGLFAQALAESDVALIDISDL